MGNFQLPRTTLMDNSGNIISGGTIEFYEAGTTTALTVYQNSSLSSAIGTSVTADSAGRVENVWISTGTEFKIVVKDADGNTLYTEDNLYTFNTQGTEGVSALDKIGSNPLTYGATGDGVDDEQAAVQSAIDNATGTVDLLGLVYRCDSPLSVPGNIRLENGTLDFSNYVSGNPLIHVNSAGALGTDLDLTADCAHTDTSVSVSSGDAGTLVAGDWVVLTSSANWAGTEKQSEILQVITSSGTTVTFTSPTRGSYTTANSAKLKEMPMVERFVARDLKIIGANNITGQVGITCSYVVNPIIEGCHFQECERAIDFDGCVNAYAHGNIVEEGPLGGEFASVRGCLNARIANNSASTKLATLTNGYGVYVTNNDDDIISRNVSVTDNTFIGVYVGVFLETECEDVLTRGNYIVCSPSSSSSSGIYDKSCSGTGHYENTIIQAQADAIYCSPTRVLGAYATDSGGSPPLITETPSLRIHGNTIRLCADDGIYVVDGVPSEYYGVSIQGNTIAALDTNYAISVNANAESFRHVNISDNQISECSIGIGLLTTSTGTITYATINGNTIHRSSSAAGNGINLSSTAIGAIRQINVEGNTIQGFFNGVNAANQTHLMVTGNNIRQPGDIGVLYSNSVQTATADNILINNNNIDNPSGEGIKLQATGNASYINSYSISYNTINDAGDDCISITMTGAGQVKFGQVNGNTLHNPSDYGIKLSGGQAGGIGNLIVSGNSIHSPGNTGIELDFADYVVIANNTMSGDAAAPTSWIVVDDTTMCAITGNQLNAGGGASGIAIHVDNTTAAKTTDGIDVSGNTIRSFDGDGIVVAQHASGTLTGLKIQNNSLDGAGTDL